MCPLSPHIVTAKRVQRPSLTYRHHGDKVGNRILSIYNTKKRGNINIVHRVGGGTPASKVLSGLYYYLLSASDFKKQKLNVDFVMKVIHRSSRVVVAGFLLRSACYLKMI